VSLEKGVLFAVVLAALVLFVWERWRHDLVAVGARLLAFAAGLLVRRGTLRTACLHLAVVTAAVLGWAGGPDGGWRDVSGQPLPFQDHETIRNVMRSARVVSREEVGRGVAGTERLVLEHEGTRVRAAFRAVDRRTAVETYAGSWRRTREVRDAAIFELAAYELSELLGIGRVPPVVERTVDGVDGTVQLWVEGAVAEVELDEVRPPDVERWLQQKQVMRVFDSLIANPDRNRGNLLVDREWTIWLIDHTRAFRETARLLYVDQITGCERTLWERLQSLDERTLRQRLGPYLEAPELSTLVARHRRLVRHLRVLIRTRGEATVLFNLRPPAAAQS